MVLGDRLKEIRHKLLLSQRLIAKELGVSYNAVYMYEASMRVPQESVRSIYVKLSAKVGLPLVLEDFRKQAFKNDTRIHRKSKNNRSTKTS
jgi:transcriptional regulator with XRE-family HTH domain